MKRILATILPAGALLVALVSAAGPRVAAAADATDAADATTALVIIDIQDFYFPGGALPLVGAEEAAAHAGQVLARFRATGRPIVHVGHNAAKGRGFRADVAPAPGEAVVWKDDVNAFQGTDLLERLRALGVTRLVLCGMQTHMCLEGAARAAHDFGFDVVVVGDACATRDLTAGGVTAPAAQVHAATLATLDGAYGKVVDTTTFLAGD